MFIIIRQVQTLLYSATIPDWVLELASTKLKKDYVMIDLVGSEDTKTALDVKHYKLELKRAALYFKAYVPLFKKYSKKKTIVFIPS